MQLVDVQLVADPGVLVALAVLLRADIAGGRQVVQHRRQVHGRLPFETCQDLRLFFALLRPPPLALGRRGRLLLRGRLLTGLDGRRVAGEVAHQPVVVRLPDQRFVHALGQLRGGELGEGAREDRLARHLAPPLPAADPPQHHIGVQPVQQHARRRQVRPPWPRRPAPSPRDPWADAPASGYRGIRCSIRMTSRVCTNCCCFPVSGPNTCSNCGNSACWIDCRRRRRRRALNMAC